MTDQDASPPPDLRPRRAARHPSALSREADMTDDASPSSTAYGANAPFSSVDQTPPHTDEHTLADKRLSTGAHRSHKHRSSGGFLLSTSLLKRNSSARNRDAPTHTPDKRHRRSAEQGAHGDAHHGHEGDRSRASSSSVSAAIPDMGADARPDGHPEESSISTATITKRDSLAGETAVGSSPRNSIAQLDVESAQIVNMALNLSESRRLAARRNITQPTPPRLAPLPDNALGGSLRYHLQQQRKVSRTVSPKPDRSPRIGSGRVFTPLQPAFEPGTSYRYHFSQSTLARAQKAKEYLELMAQYRRVLELVPPLEPERTSRPWTASPPATPDGSAPVSRVPTNGSDTRIGRAYNPLQYIRNRKVRARERKAIDGEAQGFSDVMRVSEWIDEVAKFVATGQARLLGGPALPPFSSPQAAGVQASPPANSRLAAVTKPRRPRVDWVIDPADMLADVYWLELDDNKKLVENRYWRRVFPQRPSVPRPVSRDEMARLATTPSSNQDAAEARTPGEKTTSEPQVTSRHEHEHVLSAARDRAQQKLRALKGSHHRHTSSVTNRDLLRLHRGSISESSDTDSDRRRRAKSGAAGPAMRSVLEKQMEEMLAREQMEAESHPLYDPETQRIKPIPMTPEREPPRASQDLDSRRRADSRAELSEAETKGLGLKPLPLPRSSPAQGRGRSSLEVPRDRRFSVDDDTSQPTSPDMRPARDVGLVPAIGMDLSPISSRQSSPHRNPLTRVKSIFRERSKERSPEAHPVGEDIVVSLSPPTDSWVVTPETAGSGVSSPQRRPSRSPAGERAMGHRSHKSLGGGRMRGEDGSISIRSLLRGPRIDTVLRSGVSKVSDMLWRKDADEDSSSTSSDESDDESRGRSRGPRHHSRSTSMQQFAKGWLEAPLQLLPEHAKSGQLSHPPSRPISRRSSRFDLLKPPRIDVQNASPSQTPPVLVSDTESQAGRDDVRAAAARLDAALTLPNPPRASTSSSSRQWSIAEREASTARNNSNTHAISKRDIARLRALLLSSGLHAREMDRRARERKLLPSPLAAPTTTTTTTNPHPHLTTSSSTTTSSLTPLSTQAQTLATAITSTTTTLHSQTLHFTSTTAPTLLRRAESLRERVAGELASLAQSAVDAADEAGHDLAVGQRLKVKGVVDAMETMLRRRRRRFRWVRRAGWLVVEWLLVGCMWYVWFVVVLVRVVVGLGRGLVGGVRWLLWL